MAAGVEVSVVLPAYNEADTIAETVSVTLDALADFLPAGSYEVIVAEDGCTDRTPEIVADLADATPAVRHVHADERLGRGRALEFAFREARGETLVYFDTDLATDLAHLEELVESVRSGGYDVATGSRWLPESDADRPARRGVPSRGYNALVRLVLRSNLRDHQCGFKAFDRDALERLLDEVGDDHWFWDTEVLVRAQRVGYRVREFPIEWTPRGDSKVDLVRDVLGMGSQIVRTWWELSVNPRLTRRASLVAGTLLVLVAIALMSVYLDPATVVAEMAAADLGLVAVAAALYLTSWPLRGLRYRDILDRLDHHERVGFLTGAIFISQTGNLVFPARAGDAVRAYVLKARRAIPYTAGFASLAIERVFDLLTIAALAGAVLVGLVATGSTAGIRRGLAETGVISGTPQSGRTALLVAAFVGTAALVAVVLIVASARSERNYVRAAMARMSTDRYADTVAGVVERFVGDVQTVATDRATFLRVGASSLVIWSLDVATAIVVLGAFGVAVSLPTLVVVGVFAVSVGNLAKVLPLSPGGIGLYEGAFTVLVVGLTPIGAGTALAAAIVDHAVKNVVTIAGGVVAMATLNVSLTTAVRESAEVEAPAQE
jgi:uncharacterized protein (TIRG00374 family)